MTRLWNRLIRRGAGEEGFALITVMLIVMVMSLLAAVMVANLTSELSGVGRQRQVTTALGAADAGLDQLVFELQQSTNWTSFKTSYSTAGGAWWKDPSIASGNPNFGWWGLGKGRYRAHIDCSPSNDCTINPNDQLITIEGQYPAGTGPIRTIQAVVRRSAPQALTFALFADRGFDEHHHGSSWVTPTIITTKLHSNGYVKLDWNSSFHVDEIEAATSFTGGSGGGSTPGGSVPSTGYNWAYWLPGTATTNSSRCYPPKLFPPKTVDSSDSSFSTYWNVPDASHACPASSPKYSPNNQIIGDIYANSVSLNTHSDTVKANSGTTCSGTTQAGINDSVTGACIPDRNGDVHAGSFSAPGVSYTGASSGNTITTHHKTGTIPAPCSGSNCLADCTICNQGTSDSGGKVGGSVYVHPTSWSPGTVPFPSLDYRGVYYPLAQADQGGAATCANKTKTCHIFPTSDNAYFLTYISTRENRTDHYDTSTCKTCMFWLDSNYNDTGDPTHVKYVILKGTYFLTSNHGGLTLDAGTLKTLFGLAADKPAPTVMIQGSLVAENGNISVKASLTVVGLNMDPFNPLGSYPANTVPGLLAAGGSITASDYDSDSSWTSSTQYESLKRNAATVRGLVYSAQWNPALGKSIPTDQHWHNYDPKNSTTIIGAQVGGRLHDCNSFLFAYDPLVSNILGFTTGGSGGVYVVNWQEVPTPA